MAKCAFSGREIDLACPDWLRTPDGQVVQARFYEAYMEQWRKEHDISPTAPLPTAPSLEMKLGEEVVLDSGVSSGLISSRSVAPNETTSPHQEDGVCWCGKVHVEGFDRVAPKKRRGRPSKARPAEEPQASPPK